jgi:UDP-N-acetylglucosamine--N-acetylmuramyl-(pentapeptide) pyrophosphoryl-undecaprenol N-acetylglucosamine transferase
VGVGGYAAGPIVLAAALMGKRTMIHEQNTIPGITNRVLARFVDLIFMAFEASRTYFPEKKIRVIGNPIRRDLIREAVKIREGGEDGANRRTILVLGGSQGAHFLNTEIPKVLVKLGERMPLNVVHQTGPKDEAIVSDFYSLQQMHADVRPFIHDMAWTYSKSDFVICRAGALTVSELCLFGLPALLIPFPFAADNHQELNAMEMVKHGAAYMVKQSEFTSENAASLLEKVLSDPQNLKTMSEKSKQLGRLDSARIIVDAIYQGIGERR